MLARGLRGIKQNGTARAARWLLYWLPALLWMAGIAYLSHQTEPLGRTASTGEASVAHLAVFGVLGLLLLWALAAANGAGRDFWVLPFFAVGIAVLFGVIDEVHQAYVPGRTASEADVATDALGAALGVSLGALFGGFWRTIRRTR